MEKWATELTKNLKGLSPKKNNCNVYTATIESLAPFRATIAGGVFVLNKDNTKTCINLEAMLALEGSFSLPRDGGNGSFNGKAKLIDFLRIGDSVIVLTDNSGQNFYILGKVGQL